MNWTRASIVLLTWITMLTGYLDDRSVDSWGEYLKGALDLIISVVTAFILYFSFKQISPDGIVRFWLPFFANEIAVNELVDAAGYGGVNGSGSRLDNKASYQASIETGKTGNGTSNFTVNGTYAGITMNADTRGSIKARNQLEAGGAASLIKAQSSHNLAYDNAVKLKNANLKPQAARRILIWQRLIIRPWTSSLWPIFREAWAARRRRSMTACSGAAIMFHWKAVPYSADGM
jgi:hypothetical protein